MSLKFLRLIATVAMLVSLLVIMLGAYTRLTHAGLGCPDWPGCYGQITAPSALSHVQAKFPDTPIESRKAWTEMIHRYAAGTLVLLIAILSIGIFRASPRHKRVPIILPLFLMGLIIFQALLGMWTVTLKLLPWVVMGHLLGGILIFSCLSMIRMQLSDVPRILNKRYRNGITVAMGLVFCQIGLGGWVSSNYAGIACIGFPQCNGQWIPALNFREAFNFLLPIGTNYLGGILDSVGRVTIQWTHRVGAVIVGCYMLSLVIVLLRGAQYALLRFMALFAGFLICFQWMLGMLNVFYSLPLSVAVSHNGVAALLLGWLTMMRYVVSREVQYVRSY